MKVYLKGFVLRGKNTEEDKGSILCLYILQLPPEMLHNEQMKDDLQERDLFWGALYQPQKGQWLGCWESTWMSYVTHGPQVIPPDQMQTETSSLAAATKPPGCIHRTCFNCMCVYESAVLRGCHSPRCDFHPLNSYHYSNVLPKALKWERTRHNN